MDEGHRRIILPDLDPGQSNITVRDEEFHYLKNVIRLKAGDTLKVLDGKGWELDAFIVEIKKKSLTIKITQKMYHERKRKCRLTLVQAVLKGEKMDIVLQKATELGVDVVVPVFTEHTAMRSTRKYRHWQRVCLEATRQSRRLFMPETLRPCEFRKALEIVKGDYRFILHEKAESTVEGLLQRNLKGDVVVVVGPEGGFSHEEAMFAIEKGFEPVRLSENILRAETAAIVSVFLFSLLLNKQ
jgi:16S rRNA (uracil1498-N3)-methyltransferase